MFYTECVIDKQLWEERTLHRFWRRNKKTIINSAIALVAVAAVILFEWISAKKMEETTMVETPDKPIVEQPQEPEKEEEKTLPVTITAAAISDGEILTFGENCIKKNKDFTFEADVEEMGTIIIRHGDKTYGASWLTLDETKVEVYSFGEELIRSFSEDHGLEMGGALKVQMHVKANEAMDLTITSGGKTFARKEVGWEGCKGKIEVESIGNELSNVKAEWNSPDLAKDIWVLGDSYLGSRWKNCWPYYAVAEGHDNALFTGFPGATSSAMYKEWKRLLEYDTPKFAVWCLGMSDGDSSGSINMAWRAKLQLFLADCKELGITPILATIPNTPVVNNTFKNQYVRESGYRYIDFAKAVGASRAGSMWLDGLLSFDQVQPTTAGAEALAKQVEKDFPELIGKKIEE